MLYLLGQAGTSVTDYLAQTHSSSSARCEVMFPIKKGNEIEVWSSVNEFLCCITAAVLYSISSLLEVLQLLSKPPEGAVSPRMAVRLQALQLTGMQVLGWLQGWHAAGTLGAKSPILCGLTVISVASANKSPNEDVVPIAGEMPISQTQNSNRKPLTPFR